MKARLLHENLHEIQLNLAREHAILEKLQNREEVLTVRLWRNNPCVVIGRTQDYITEVNEKYCKENNIAIARRISGGGAVFHDLNNLNISFFANRKLFKNSRDTIRISHIFTEILKKSLIMSGFDISIHSDTNLMYRDRKISGSASHSKGLFVLHHATLLQDVNLDMLENSLKIKEFDITKKRQSRYLPTVNLRDFDQDKWLVNLIDTLENYFGVNFVKGEISDKESYFAKELLRDLYLKEHWIKNAKRKLRK